MEGLYCPVDRHEITSLAKLIHERQPDLKTAAVAEVLKGTVNITREKISKEHTQIFTKGNSISGHEAYAFIRKLKVAGALSGGTRHAMIARNLHEIFFGGMLFSPMSLKPRPVKIIKCHDADTCKVIESQPSGCNAGPSTVSVRISGVDAPEVGYYSEKKADASRGKDSIYGKPRRSAAGGWINPKMVSNVDSIHKSLAAGNWKTKGMNYWDRVSLNAIIAATIDYTGTLATIPNNDLITFGLSKSEEGAAFMIDSQIRWTSSDTPECLCESLQPYDIYGRALGSFLSTDADRLVRYVRDQLPISMKTKGMVAYNKYLEKVKRHLTNLKKSKTPAIREAAKRMVKSAPNPTKIYSKAKCAELAKGYDGFLHKVGGLLDGDIQAMQIYTGMIYEYAKYLNQRGMLYKMAGDVARKGKVGQWEDLSFSTLWNVNLKKPRYHPKDCAKK